MNPDSELKDEVDKLIFLLERGNLTYTSYLEDGKKFLYAKILRSNNEEIRCLLLSLAYRLSLDLKRKSLALVHHLDVWIELWDGLAESRVHDLDDPFVFQNSVNYPSGILDNFKSFSSSLDRKIQELKRENTISR